MTPHDFEATLRLVVLEYQEAATGGMGLDYEALQHSVATSGTASVPTVSGQTIRRLIARDWLEKAVIILCEAIQDDRQLREYLSLVLTTNGPRTPREHALYCYCRSALSKPLAQGGLTWIAKD